MTAIIAGHFQLQDEIDQAKLALLDAGFPAERISAFFVNPAGQHDVLPLGGDRDKSPGAKESGVGVVQGELAGGAVGAAIGALTTPVTGPLGAVVGALVGGHVGSLYSLSHMKEAGEKEEGSIANQVEPRHSGMMIAVALPDGDEQRALDVLRRLGAQNIERADGHIVDGDWKDFNPLSLPVPVEGRAPGPVQAPGTGLQG
ncbi:MAG: glycine zipper domain-containing protein [Pseudomonadota bacterium]